MFDQTEIQQLAGLQSFLKGMVIQKEDGVQNLNIQGSTITATVVGQQKYRVKIDCDSLGESDCTCPAYRFRNGTLKDYGNIFRPNHMMK